MFTFYGSVMDKDTGDRFIQDKQFFPYGNSMSVIRIFGYSPFRNIAPYGAIFHSSFSPISSPCGGL